MPYSEKVIRIVDELILEAQKEATWKAENALRCLKKELLKEQEAVPVVQREVMHMLVWCCGSCGVAITDGDKFCRMCGKEVKWNGSGT